jgi:hypothetical protein
MASESNPKSDAVDQERRALLQGAAATALSAAMTGLTPLAAWPMEASTGASLPAGDMDAVRAEITKRHDEALQRLQDWIKHPSPRKIAA